MKIRLLEDLPIDPKYGMTKETVHEAKINRKISTNNVRWWVKHPSTGEKIGVLWREAEEIKD